MTANDAKPGYRLYYWPIAFRGCFVSYLFAYRDVPLQVVDDVEQIRELMGADPGRQPVPFVGTPVLEETGTGRTLSQMPAIVLYAAGKLDLLPRDPFDAAMSMKILMDCNDVLMELCRYNGSLMWDRQDWALFRTQRLPRWLALFEESLGRGHIGTASTSCADVAVYALFGNMMRCLEQLAPDVRQHAPGIHALCKRVGSQSSLAAYVAAEQGKYGSLYCGGQIEQSIRAMLARDTGA